MKCVIWNKTKDKYWNDEIKSWVEIEKCTKYNCTNVDFEILNKIETVPGEIVTSKFI